MYGFKGLYGLVDSIKWLFHTTVKSVRILGHKRVNAKAMPTSDTNYSYHIEAVEPV